MKTPTSVLGPFSQQGPVPSSSRAPTPCSQVTHLPAVPKHSLCGVEPPIWTLQIILGKAIEVPAETTSPAPVGTGNSHLHLGLPIPQYLCKRPGLGMRKERDPKELLC